MADAKRVTKLVFVDGGPQEVDVPDLRDLANKAQKLLTSVLDELEQVLVAQPGESAALVATDRRILLCKWGLYSGSPFGSQVNSWDFAHVTGIEYRKGMRTKAIVIQTAGAQVVTKFGRLDNGSTSVWEAPNALFITGDEGEASVATLRQMILDYHHRSQIAPVALNDADQLRKFAGLRDDGIISEEEFQAKKRSILGI